MNRCVLIIMIAFLSCSNSESVKEVVKEKYADGTPKVVEIFEGNKKVKEKEFYTNGQLKRDCAFNDTLRNGECLLYHENGNLQSKGSFVDGKRNGWIYDFLENGKRERSLYTEMGEVLIYLKYYGNDTLAVEMNSIEQYSKAWHENGVLKAFIPDSNGTYVEYDSSGVKLVEGEIKEGVYVGTWKYWNTEGQLTKEEKWVDGTVQSD